MAAAAVVDEAHPHRSARVTANGKLAVYETAEQMPLATTFGQS
jgi:hypothetical protein